MKICFVSAGSRKEIQSTVDFLAVQSLGYPRYQEWVGRAESELNSGYKMAIMAFFDDRLVASPTGRLHALSFLKTGLGALLHENRPRMQSPYGGSRAIPH